MIICLYYKDTNNKWEYQIYGHKKKGGKLIPSLPLLGSWDKTIGDMFYLITLYDEL